MPEEQTRLSVSASADGLNVHLPSGRVLRISADEAGARFLRKMLQDADEGLRGQRGYIGDFPTQEITRIWERAERQRQRVEEQARSLLAEDAAARAEAKRRSAEAKAKQAKRVWAKRGIDTSKVKINL